ncbi:MAG: hypothetical protein LBS90_08400 [Oscillospiraceae bacterium]|jgi:hypothetical protein|nr:hypothetical protein [Oscillospiraceae bacterium]
MPNFEDALNKILSSPEDMAKIAELAKSFSVPQDGAEPAAEPESRSEPAAEAGLFGAAAGIDPKLFSAAMTLLGEYNGASDKQTLINALSPYLGEEKRGKLGRAAELAKLARVARRAMREFGNQVN